MALGRYAIGAGMTLSLAARADQRSLFAGLTSLVQRTVFFALAAAAPHASRSEEHTSELQSLMRISYAVFCLKKKKTTQNQIQYMPVYIDQTTTHQYASRLNITLNNAPPKHKSHYKRAMHKRATHIIKHK